MPARFWNRKKGDKMKRITDKEVWNKYQDVLAISRSFSPDIVWYIVKKRMMDWYKERTTEECQEQ